MKRWIAIDFGTTNSAVACFGSRGPEIIKVDGRDLVPSVVTVAGEKAEVGHAALRLRKRHPEHTFTSFKRHFAELFNPDEAKGSQMVQGEDGLVHYQGPGDFTYSPVELASFVMEKLRLAAEVKLRAQIGSAVICVPAAFKGPQRDALREAAKMAGFEEIELMDEPTAAAVAYGYDFERAHTIAVVDVGGGTTDVSIIRTGKGLVRVLGTDGTPLVGGEDWDKHIRGYVVNLHQLENEGSTVATRTKAMNLLLAEAEDTKKRLTEMETTEFRVEDIDKDRQTGTDIHAIYPISREIMDEATSELLKGIEGAMQRAVASARRDDPKFTIRDLDAVIVVGGMTRVQAIQRLVAEFFKQEPKTDIDPEIAVALGAAVRAGVKEGRNASLTISDVTGHTYALETHDKVEDVATVLAPKGTRYGSKFTFWLSNREPGQEIMTFRLLQGESPIPSECVTLWEHQIKIEKGDPRSARVKLELEIGPSGEAIVECDGQTFGRAA